MQICKSSSQERRRGRQSSWVGIASLSQNEPRWFTKNVYCKHVKEGGTREKQLQCWRRPISLLRAFNQSKNSLRKRKEDKKSLEKGTFLMCVIGKTSAIGGIGKGLRWNVSRQLAGICKQGWMSDTIELLLEECEAWLTQKKKRRKAERIEQQIIWVGKLPSCWRSKYAAQHETVESTSADN